MKLNCKQSMLMFKGFGKATLTFTRTWGEMQTKQNPVFRTWDICAFVCCPFWPTACFCKIGFIQTQPLICLYVMYCFSCATVGKLSNCDRQYSWQSLNDLLLCPSEESVADPCTYRIVIFLVRHEVPTLIFHWAAPLGTWSKVRATGNRTPQNTSIM